MITFSSASASWRDAQDNVPGAQAGDPVITNGIPTSSISWGGSSPQSGYDVTITIPDPQQFPVADFTHRNFPVSPPSLTSVVLDIVIDFDVDGLSLGPLTFTFTFNHEETPNNLNPCPYPTPPGEGCTDRVTFLDAPLPTTFTVGGKTYTLGLTFLDGNGNPVDEFISSEGGVSNTADLDVEFALVPPVFEVTKSGPATMAPGQAGVFTIDAQNTGPNDAWNTTISDLMPDGATGGMCDATPQVLSAQVFAANGATVPGKGPLLQGTDFSLSYAAAPTCELTLTMLSAMSVVAENERLIISYQTQLDGGTLFGEVLTNVAGATEWFDDDVSNPLRGSYTEVLSDGTTGSVDHEDAHTLSTDLLDYLFEKTVVDPVSGALLTTAAPGDTLRYQLRIENRTLGPLVGLGFTDEMDRLNGSPLFEPGSLTPVTIPAGADTSGTNPNGGTAGTGVIDVRDISVAAGNSELVEFDVTLVSPITAGTLVTDQAELLIADVPFGLSDDPGVNGAADPFTSGDEDPTVLLVVPVPDLLVEKISADLTGNAALLLPGDTLQYTITVRNPGSQDVTDGTIRDAIPVNTSYVVGSTTLNGTPVPDGAGGLAPFVTGLALSVPADPTPGSIPADPSGAPANTATLIFQVTVNPGLVDGTILSNQAFVSALAAAVSDQPSDDPTTPLVNDPTQDVVGNRPLLFASKQVVLGIDGGTPGVIDPGDTLHYTITTFNTGTAPATGAVLADAVPTNTTWVGGSLLLNGEPIADVGVSPLIAGIDVSSSDLTPPLPGPGLGTLTPGESAVVEFDVLVDAAAPAGAIISNQAVLTTNERPALPSDGDGDPTTGPEPTIAVVGNGQALLISKLVSVVGGGAALAGSEVEYVVQVTNVANVVATNVVITDDLDDPVAGQLGLVAASATLNGLPTGVTVLGSVITADYSTTYGPLGPGATVTLRFRATISAALAIGTTVTNTGIVNWAAAQSANASVSFDVGGQPGVGALAGTLWHDADFDASVGAGETLLAGWIVELFLAGQLVVSTTSDAGGVYQFSGLPPNDVTGQIYTLRFTAPDATTGTASIGDGDSLFTNAPQEIQNIVLPSGSNVQDLNLPITPNGVVYNSVLRAPVLGATLRLLAAGSGSALPSSCFDDPNQQGQITRADGFYKFNLNFSDLACSSGGNYLIAVTPPSTGFIGSVSTLIPPTSDPLTAPLSVPTCPVTIDDAVPATDLFCEAQVSALAPPASVPPATAGTTYHLHLTLDSNQTPGSSQIFNNHVPLDPDVSGLIAITKTSSLVNVSRGQQVPYTITFGNDLAATFPDLSIVDRFPKGFRYVEGSAHVDGRQIEPVINGRELLWENIGIGATTRRRIVLLLTVGAGVSDGEFVNRAQALRRDPLAPANFTALSGEASASVRVVPDPTFDCTDVLGKVFDDVDRNGVQDRGEAGLQGVKLVTPRGLVATTDRYGRFHITCAIVPNERRGSNFALKLDDRSLPSGYRLSTRQTQVKRATAGKALRFQFGASIYRVVSLDIADAVFEPDSTEMREQWRPRLQMLLDELAKSSSTLRLSYLADVESEDLAEDRLEAVKDEIEEAWKERDAYPLTIETEIFWRRGAPVERPDTSDKPFDWLPFVDAGPPDATSELP